MVLRKCSKAGRNCSCSDRLAETWIAVGITSLELCPRLTWSFGWIVTLAARVASVAITSLAFMLLEVPEPV